MSFLPVTNKNGILAGIYLVNAVVAPLTIFYSVSLTQDIVRYLSLTGISGLLQTLVVPPSAPLPTPS